MKKSSLFILFAISALFATGNANAVPFTLTGSDRTATVDWAIGGAMGDGNPQASDVKAAFGGDWTDEGHLDKDNDTPPGGSDKSFTIEFTSGSWDSQSVTGNWEIASSFWSTYANAVIAMHLGGGDEKTPEHFLFQIKPGQTSGTWSYDKTSGGGGGFSNIQLYGNGTPHNAPDAGSTLALMGLALGGIATSRRFLKKA